MIISEELMTALKASLVSELYASMFYFQCAHNLKGKEYEVFHHFFKKEWKDELGHMNILAKKIAGYGEVVELPAISCEVITDLDAMLEKAYKDEVWAVERYTTQSNMAKKEGHNALSALLDDICMDEEGHKLKLLKLMGK